MNETEVKVLRVLRKDLPGLFKRELTDEYILTRTMTHIGLDSLHVVEVVMLVEEVIGCDLPDDSLNLTTLREILNEVGPAIKSNERRLRREAAAAAAAAEAKRKKAEQSAKKEEVPSDGKKKTGRSRKKGGGVVRKKRRKRARA